MNREKRPFETLDSVRWPLLALATVVLLLAWLWSRDFRLAVLFSVGSALLVMSVSVSWTGMGSRRETTTAVLCGIAGLSMMRVAFGFGGSVLYQVAAAATAAVIYFGFSWILRGLRGLGRREP